MIKSIEIENFRGIQQGKLDGLTPLTILVGPNGCGKSTILDAVFLGAHQDPAAALRVVTTSRLRLTGAARWLLWRIELLSRCVISLEFDNSEQRTIIFGKAPVSRADVPPRLFTSLQREPLNGRDSVVTAIEGPPLTVDALILGKSDSEADVGLIDLAVPTKREYLVDLFTRTRVAGRREEVTALVRSVIPSVEAIEILTEDGVPVIHLGYESTSVPAALSGDGIHDLLRLCLELASRPNGIVLLEEPEVHQHPGALRQSARAILAAVRRGIQVIVTTHDLELIDFLLSECVDDIDLEKVAVIRLKLDDGCMKSSTLSGSEAALSRFQIEDDLR